MIGSSVQAAEVRFQNLGVVGAEGGLRIRVEQQVELGALGDLRRFGVMGEVVLGARQHVRIAPGGDVVAFAREEQAELHHGGIRIDRHSRGRKR